MLASVVYFSSLLAQAATVAPTAAPAASPAATAASQSAPFTAQLPFFLIIGVMFYFVLLRPQQKRAKEQATLLSSVRSGDEVVTSGGLHGIVTNVREAGSKTVLVKFAENVKIEVDRSAIVSVSKPGGSAEAETAAPAIKVS